MMSQVRVESLGPPKQPVVSILVGLSVVTDYANVLSLQVMSDLHLTCMVG